MKEILLVLIVIILFIKLIDKLDKDNINYCDSCVNRKVCSNQFPTICDECENHSNYEYDKDIYEDEKGID